MSQLIPLFYKSVHTICMTENETDLINYLSNTGLTLLKEILSVEIHASFNTIQCRDFGCFLIHLIPVCYNYISNEDADCALSNLPPVDSKNDDINPSTSSIFQALEYMFNTIVHLFYFHDHHSTNTSVSELNNVHIEIAQALVNLSLPQLTTEYKIIWYYQKKFRSILLIFRKIISFQSSTFTTSFPSNSIESMITIIYNYLSSSSISSQYLIQLAFDILQGLTLFIENILTNFIQNNSNEKQSTNDLLIILNQFLMSDYFSLFNLLSTNKQYEFRSQSLLEHYSIILKRLKIYRSEESQRKQNRKIIKTSWQNTYEQAHIYHHHQSSFEIIINNKNNFDGHIEIKTNNEDNNQVKRMCVVSGVYDKLLRFAFKQLESNQPSFPFIQDCLSYLASYGSCSCYSLSHYRTLLSKINHLKTDEKQLSSLEQQSIHLLRQAFLLLLNCSQRNHHHHHYDSQLPDNTLFWSYLSSNLFQRPSHYSIKLIRAFPDLIQCCSINDKQLALRFCITPALEHYRSTSSIQNTTNTQMIEYLVQTLPNLLFDIIIDTPLISLSDTLISLSTTLPSLLIHTLPVLGCLLTSTSDCLNLNISDSFLKLIIKLTNTWSFTNDGIDNLCHILIILLQKCSTFRQTFYAHLCHLKVYEHFQSMLNNNLPIQSSIIASVLVSISYYTKSNDKDFNYKLILEQITLFSEKNRYNQSWFELLVRLSLSQQYQDKRTRWKSSINYKNQSFNENDDEHSTTSTSSILTNVDTENDENIDEDEVYYGDIESFSDEIPIEKIGKQNQTIYSNLILFPELVILGLEFNWQNVDHEWSDQQTMNKSSIYVTNLVSYLEILSSLVRSNSYNCIVLKKLNIDGYLFTCLTKIVPRSSFIQKDTLITLIITLLQFLWSQSMTVNQLDQCFKLILTHRSLVGPLLRLFKHLVHQIDTNQPRSFCSMPLSSIVTAKGGNNLRLTLEQLLSLKYPQLESEQTTRSVIYNNVRQSAFVTETLKTVQFQFPLTIAIWLRVNYPFDKHEANDEHFDENEELNKKDYRPYLHILTLHHECFQLQFWLDSKPNICLKIVQLSSATNSQQLTDFNIRLYTLPRESWSHVFLTISKTTNTVSVCLNGQTALSKSHSIPSLYSSNSPKPWSISLGQQSLDTCTCFYYDLGSILLFDRIDLTNEMNDYIPTYLFSLGSDHWHFLTANHQQQFMVNYWIYQRFTRVHSTVSIDNFEMKQHQWHTILKRSLLASYSSNNPWTLFLFNTNSDTNEDIPQSRLTKILPFRSSTSSSTTASSSSISIHDDNLLTTTTTISLPSKISLEQSSNILNICEQLGGILNFIYLFGKIIELNAYQSPLCICHITDIIFTSLWKIKSYYDLFNSLDGYRLIVKILTTNECTRHISMEFYEVLIDKCIISNQQRLYDINLFRFILLDWRIWYNHTKIFYQILNNFNDLLSEQTNLKYFYVNRQLFKMNFTLEHLLIFYQELIDEQQQIIVDKNITKVLVNIIEALVENDINIIALLMNFILITHPLIKTYVTYNKEHFYFLIKPFNSYQKKEKISQEINQNNNPKNYNRQRSTTTIIVNNEEQIENSQNNNDNNTLNIRKSHSCSDLLASSTSIGNEGDSYNTRRTHHITVTGVTSAISPSKTFTNESNLLGIKDCPHNVDDLSTGILQLLSNIALTTSDRLMMKLIDNVFRLNILIVLLLDASMTKRVQCIKLLDIILKRMDKEKVQTDVIRADLHTLLANQIYHQLDGRDDEKELVEVCVSIALQRPIQFDIKQSLSTQIHDAEQYFSILTSSPPCPQSHVGFALVLSLIEKLSMTNSCLCELMLNLLDEIIQRSNDENRHFLIEIGLTQVLFNTLSSSISSSQNKLILSVQKCFNSLITTMFTTTIHNDISFISIIETIMGIMMINNNDTNDEDLSKQNRRILHQTLSNMFNSIIDSIEKLPSNDISSIQRHSTDDNNSTMIENCDRFRKFLQLALDYIYLFHNECSLFENFTLRLLDTCLIGIAYLIEKRSNYLNTRHQLSFIMIRSGDIIKQTGQKLLTLALDPDNQRFFFRIQILKHINQQPNAKAIMEYLLNNDIQCSIYHQILIYLQILSNTTPTHADFEHLNNHLSHDQSRKSIDSGHSTITTLINTAQTLSNGEESSHTISVLQPSSKHHKPPINFEAKDQINNEQSSTGDEEDDEEEEEEQDIGDISSSSITNDEQDISIQKTLDRSSSSPSLSISSTSSELIPLQQSFIINYQSTIYTFRDLMRGINIHSLTVNDNNHLQRRALTDYLLTPTTSTSSDKLNNNNSTMSQRHSFDWPPSIKSHNTLSSQKTRVSTSSDRFRRRSQVPSPSPSPVCISWSTIVDEKLKEYTTTLHQTIDAIQKRSRLAQKTISQTYTDVIISTITSRAMDITQEVINLQGLERKKFLEHLRLSQSLDLRTKHLWHQLIAQLTHEYGVWFESLSYPKFWELDPTENPQRERRRLQRSYCLMEKRFFQPQVPDEILINPPLSYLFDTRHYQSINIQTVLYRNEKIEYQCRCMNVTPNNEIKGELLVGTTRIYFVADEQLSALTKNKSVNSAMTTVGYNHHSFNDDSNSFSFAINDICEMYKRRYMLKDIALELFFINGITLMIAHVSNNDRENLYKFLLKRNLIHFKHEETIHDIQTSWRQGYMTNFEYLMKLNKLAGRSYLDLMQYPVYPYIVATYDIPILDLRSSASYRNLSKPIAIQHPDKEEKFIDLYNALADAQNAAQSHQETEQKQLSVALGHQSDPYHFASLYSNSGVVLHYLVRLLPYTRMFLDYQDNNFDCADRTFHDVRTSYWLSSFESTSDFKELIPEFYYLHEFLVNKQGFNFGKRQNGEQVSDVTAAIWAKRNARLFVYGLRQALESDHVTSHLHQWIDLIFGYKQTGKAALDAINVYNAPCYYGFPVDSIDDDVIQKAYYGIIRTCGQVPKQLFPQPHPSANLSNLTSNSNTNDKRNSERAVFESKLPLDSIHRQIIGVRWGDFVGSYDMPSPDYTSYHDCTIQVSSFVVLDSGVCIMCLPSSSLIIHHEHLLNEFYNEENNSSTSKSSGIPLDTMVALKWNTPDGIVRCRSLKQSKNWYNFLVPVDDQDKITCCTSIDFRLLFMGKTSGLIEIYRIRRNKGIPSGIELIQRYLPFIAHRSPITCLYANRQFSLLISASADGMLTLWDTNRLSYVRTYKQDNQTIYHLTSSVTTGDIAYLSSSGSQWHLSYLTCNCDLIGCLTFSEQLNCLCFTSAPEGTCVNVLLGGFENGLISMWSTWDLTLLRQLDFHQLRSHPIVSICVTKGDRRRLYVADRDRHLHVIESRLSSSTSMMQPPQVLFLT